AELFPVALQQFLLRIKPGQVMGICREWVSSPALFWFTADTRSRKRAVYQILRRIPTVCSGCGNRVANPESELIPVKVNRYGRVALVSNVHDGCDQKPQPMQIPSKTY